MQIRCENTGFLLSKLRTPLASIGLVLCMAACTPQENSAATSEALVASSDASIQRAPNFIIIFTDDQGYGDLGSFGGTHVNTPNIDRMASEGMKLTSFYVPAPLCTPSRAGLMTGSYPKRVDMATGSGFPVLLASDPKGLNPDEITIAEVLKAKGYATGMVGKWHLGDQPEFMPTRQGFDEYYGIPYSHDIHPFHPKNNVYDFPDLALLEGETVIEMNPDADYLTQNITDRSVAFIKKHKDEPFFLYIPHPLPHRPVHAAPKFMKDAPEAILKKLALENGSVNYKTRDKLYPQSINEIDASVGTILETLALHGLDENTFVIFTSDNGPAGVGIGSAGPLRGSKGSTWEGGVREPAIVRWPGKIPAGTISDEILTTMDLLPTIAGLAGTAAPTDRIIDGKNIWPILSGESNYEIPYQRFYYYRGNLLEAVRSGEWKYHRKDGKGELYNLDTDIGETTNLADKHPAIAGDLLSHIEAFEKELGVGDAVCAKCRPAGWVKNPVPLGI